LCTTIAIQKGLQNFTKRGELLKFITQHGSFLTSRWRTKAFERMFLTVYFVNLLIAAFAKPNQNIYWISDEDDMFANPAHSADTVQLLSRLTSMYVKHPLGELGVGTTKLDPGDRIEEDFVAIPDLVAGGVSELITAISGITKMPAEGLIYTLPKGLTPKTRTISDWLADDSYNLKRVIVIFDKVENSTRIWRLTTG
jgi:hypothetical protein